MAPESLSELLRFAPDVYGLRWDNHVAMFTLTLELGGRRWDLDASKLTPVDDYIIIHDPTARLLMYVDCFQPSSIPLPLHGIPERLQERIAWLRDTFDFDLMLTGHATPRTS